MLASIGTIKVIVSFRRDCESCAYIKVKHRELLLSVTEMKYNMSLPKPYWLSCTVHICGTDQGPGGGHCSVLCSGQCSAVVNSDSAIFINRTYAYVIMYVVYV
jgi:hypothetical protein